MQDVMQVSSSVYSQFHFQFFLIGWKKFFRCFGYYFFTSYMCSLKNCYSLPGLYTQRSSSNLFLNRRRNPYKAYVNSGISDYVKKTSYRTKLITQIIWGSTLVLVMEKLFWKNNMDYFEYFLNSVPLSLLVYSHSWKWSIQPQFSGSSWSNRNIM